MTLLLRDREAAAEAASPPPDGSVAHVPDFACEACGAGMERGQDWCLECGTAAAGRIGGRAGWRAALTVVGLTTLLLCSAVVASYAALTSDAERSASAPTAGDGSPIVAQTPGAVVPGAVQPGATGPGVTPPAAAGVNQTPIIPAKPLPPVGNSPATSPPASSGGGSSAESDAGSGGSSGGESSSGGGSSGSSSGADTASTPSVQTLGFKKDAAQNYDPYERAGIEFGPPKNAIDGKSDTIWDVVVPADGKPIAAGLVIDLGKPYALRSLRLATRSEGFTLEVYGAKKADELPTDVIDKRWIHLTDSKAVEDGGLVYLKGKGDGAKVRLLLLYLTKPGDLEDPKVSISEVTLRGTP